MQSKWEANASKREQRTLVHYAEREHFRAAVGWSDERDVRDENNPITPITPISPISPISLRSVDGRRQER